MNRLRTVFLATIIILAMVTQAWSAKLLPAMNGLTGGTSGKLDAILAGGDSPKYGALEAGDGCIVFDPAIDKYRLYYFYIDASPQSEDSPTIIVPDWQSSGVAYTGNGAWLLKGVGVLDFLPPKTTGQAGDIYLYEANSTDTDTAGFRGPASLTDNTSYRGQFPNARPTAANAIAAWGTSSSGDGTPASPYIHTWSWIYLDDTGTNGDTGKLWSADKIYDELALKANLSGPTFTGIPAAPTAAVDTNTTQIATTAFVIGQGYAKLASPALTGTPTAPTAAADTNTTQLATTAFVLGQAYTSNPAGDGSASAGTSTRWSRGDHVHPTDTTRIAASLFDANTILAATTDNTPAAVTVGEGTVVGRASGGNIDDLTLSTDNFQISGATVTIKDDGVAAAEIADIYDTEMIPIAWFLDGTSAPDALDSTTRKPWRYRTFASNADEDVNCTWQIPFDATVGASSNNFWFRVHYIITASTAPTTDEGVAFSLSGVSEGDGDATNATKGTAVTITDDLSTGYAQWDLGCTAWSSAVTITDAAAGEMAELNFERTTGDAADDYGQLIGVTFVEIRYVKNPTR